MRIVTELLVILSCLATGIGCAKELDPRTPADIQAAIDAEHPALETCYSEALGRNRDFKGDVTLLVAFDADQTRARTVQVAKSPIDDAAFKDCVVKAFTDITLRRPPGVPLEGYYIVSFGFSEDP